MTCTIQREKEKNAYKIRDNHPNNEKKTTKSHDFCTMTQCFLTGSQFFFTRLDWMTVYYLALIIVAHLFFHFYFSPKYICFFYDLLTS